MVIAKYLLLLDIDCLIYRASLLILSKYTDLALVLFLGIVYYILKGSYFLMLQSQRPVLNIIVQLSPLKV
jgi:hypothetical protein